MREKSKSESNLKIEWVPIEEIKPNPKNPNKHSKEQIERLAKIIKENGFRNPLIVSRQSGLLVAGHGRLLASRHLGLTKIPILFQDFESIEQEFQVTVADNAIASWAELDLAQINQDILPLGPDFDIDLLGIKDFVLEPADKYGDKDADAIPALQTTTIRSGDCFQLGIHRLLCGDSTNRDEVTRLMNGEKADMVFTDPPYGMNLDTKFRSMHSGDNVHSKIKGGRNYKNVTGDNQIFDARPLLEAFSNVDEIFLFGGDYYAESLSNGGSWVVWDKRTCKDGHAIENVHGAEFELCWSKQKHQRLIARILHTGLYSIENDKRQHPTQKPVALPSWFFENWGKEAKLIVDLYLGSGSTLIACEKTNRKCYGMEIDPQYCQVIIDRFEKFTGQKAVKIEDKPKIIIRKNGTNKNDQNQPQRGN